MHHIESCEHDIPWVLQVRNGNLARGRRTWSIQQGLTVDAMLQMPFYHPTVEEGLRSALQAARRALNKRRSQPDLPLCREPVDWVLG